NGKTTTATLLFHLFLQLGYKSGLLSTIKNQINDNIITATHTTPDPIQLNSLLSDMVSAGCTHVFMEVSSHAVVQKRIEGLFFSGLLINIDGHEVVCRLVGSFNAYNLTAAYATARLLGEQRIEILSALSVLNPVEGRFDFVKSQGKITGVIDYAHTPDALQNVLTTIHDVNSGMGRIITIVGCGGDRDKAKRPVMAKIACELSDKVILTSDNPRSEDPTEIIHEMEKGISPGEVMKTISIVDRKEAIKAAVQLAMPGDIILVAGKGHEKYQEVKGVRTPFDDKKILQEMFKNIE